MKIVFLYTELADYTLACCSELSKTAEVHIVRWPVNKEAPFQFDYRGLPVYNKNEFSPEGIMEKVKAIGPDKIVCSGWIDKDYLKIVKEFYGKIPTIMALDTHWRSDLKQRLACIISRFFILNRFSHAWVPGKKQGEYARRLGFPESKITEGFYSCDTDRFNAFYTEFSDFKKKKFPKRFLYVGRYYPFKGVANLWTAFSDLQNEQSNEWELWCCGTGTLSPVAHPKIKHFGFVQPQALKNIIKDTGVFVLPSHFEPWGVVAHEYATAGYPLLLSRNVGAAEAFLNENENGFAFESNNTMQLKEALKKIINLSENDLFLMAEKSREKARQISPPLWAKNLLSMTL
jgi:glycosyltransferase involved in cell wall biosynthesis